MAAIEYAAIEHASPQAMLEAYKRARQALWNAPKPEAPSAPEPDPPLVYLSDNEYVALLAEWSHGTRRAKTPRARDILGVIAHHFEITMAELMGTSRRLVYARPRQIAMYLCVRGLGLGFSGTGRILGHRDHTTVLHGFHKTKARMETDPVFAEMVADLARRCGVLIA